MRTLLLSLLLLSQSAVPAPAQTTPPDARDDVRMLLERLDAAVGERGTQDAEAVASIDEAHRLFPDCGPKDRAAIVRSLKECFGVKRKADASGQVDDRLWHAAATALADMGPESVPVLSELIGAKAHKENLPLQRRLILSLGHTRNEPAVKTLTDLLKHKDAIVQGAAAEALGEYQGAGLELRKQAFSEMLKLLMSVKGRIDSDPNDTEARERWETIRAPILTSLKLVSKRGHDDPDKWQRWWNKNKKKDWDNEEDEWDE